LAGAVRSRLRGPAIVGSGGIRGSVVADSRSPSRRKTAALDL